MSDDHDGIAALVSESWVHSSWKHNFKWATSDFDYCYFSDS
jgi:hypothetical protein